MVKEFKFPDVGEGITEGTLLKWLVKKGDSVKEDQNVAEVETDKSVVEIPSPYTGVVKDLLAKEESVIHVGDVIMAFEDEGHIEEKVESQGHNISDDKELKDDKDTGSDANNVENSNSNDNISQEKSDNDSNSKKVKNIDHKSTGHQNDANKSNLIEVIASPHVKKEALRRGLNLSGISPQGNAKVITMADLDAFSNSGSSKKVETDQIKDIESNEKEVVSNDSKKDIESDEVNSEKNNSTNIKATPRVRNLAKEQNIDLNNIVGTGFKGNITEDDLLKSTKTSKDNKAQDLKIKAKESSLDNSSKDVDKESVSTNDSTIQDSEKVDAGKVPLTAMRKAIASNMMKSQQNTAAVTLFEEFDMTEVDELISKFKEKGVKLTYLSIFMKALTVCIKEYPDMAGKIVDNDLVYSKSKNIGFAVDTSKGLLVPVIKNVENMSIKQIASSIKDLAVKARDKGLSKENMSEGVFTISSLGGIGGKFFTPIINYPETAILGIGHSELKPKVVANKIKPRNICFISLTFDHRVVDGAMAARFVSLLKDLIESVEKLFMEMS